MAKKMAYIAERMGKMGEIREDDVEMTIELELDDGRNVLCDILTILEVDGKDYIAVLPQDEADSDGDVWIYGFKADPDDPEKDPDLIFIADDDEYEKVAEAFEEWADDLEED